MPKNHLLGRGGIIAAALLVVACLTGCSTSGSDDPGDGELLSSVDTMFGKVDIPKPDGELRVLALGWSDAETALALGVKPIALKDYGNFGEDNKGVGPWATPLFGDEDPTVIPYTTDQSLDYELIQSLNPDVILYVSSANSEDEFKRLSEIAPTVFGPKDTPAFAPGWRVQTEVISEALGLEEEGDELIAQVDQQFADAKAQHPEFADLTAVTGLKFTDAYGAQLPGDVRFDFLADLGFEASPEVLDLENPQGFYVPVSAEQISVLDADVTVFFPIGYTVEEVRDDRLIQSLDVVQDGRAIFLGEPGELTQAFTAGSVLSMPIVLESTLPLLSDAAAKVS